MNPVNLRRLLVSLVLLAAVPSACGGNGNGTPTPTPTPDGQQTTPAETIAPGQAVGRVIQVIESLARIGEQRAAGGDELFQGSVMATDERGRATFSVLDVLEDCQIQAGSRLTVVPQPRTPLELDRGSLICRSKPGADEFRIDAGQAIVEFLDPIFLIEVAESRSDVAVDFGFVQVSRSSGSEGVLVGPGGRITVGPSGMPDRAQSYRSEDLDLFNRQALNRLRRPLPAPPSGFPGTGRSGTLARVRSADELSLGVDSSGSRSVERFTGGLFEVVARRWGVGTDLDRLDADDAARALASGSLDVFVSRQQVPGAARITLFGDEQERSWSLWVWPDRAFQGALEEMLRAILNNGEYGAAYAGAFGGQPTYEAVRSLVYPSRQQFNRTQWRTPSEPSPTVAPTGGAAEVASVTLEADPAQYQGECPATIDFQSEVEIDEPGTIRYEYETHTGARLGRRSGTFEESGTFSLPTFSLLVEDDTIGWLRLVVLDQDVESEQAEYAVICVG